MGNNKRKRFSLLLTSLMAFSLALSACGGDSNNAATNSSGAGGDGASSEKPVELIWYTIGGPQKDLDRVVEEVNKYTKEKINVTLKMNMIDFGDYTQKMQVKVAAGEPMDILFTCSWAFDYVQNARKGAFMELDSLLNEYGKGIVDTIDPALWKAPR